MSRETLKTAVIASLCGTLAGVAVQAAPRPVPAPAGMSEQTLRQELATLRAMAEDADQAAWEWRAFQRCTYQHVRITTGRPSPVLWKTSARDCFQ